MQLCSEMGVDQLALKFLLQYGVLLIQWKMDQNPEQLNGSSCPHRPHRVLFRIFSKLLAIYNKSASTKEKHVCVFLDRKVLSPCHCVESAFLAGSLGEASGLSKEKGATWQIKISCAY